MTRARVAVLAAGTGHVLVYAAPALLLAWFAGGQQAFGRIDAGLAIPWLMPGALLLAWRVRDRARAAQGAAMAAATAGLLLIQLMFHLLLGGRAGGASLLVTALAGGICCALAAVLVARARRWRAAARWPALLAAAALAFAAGQGLLAWCTAPRIAEPRPKLAILTGLPLRWNGGGGDLAAMLASGPSDAPALAALERRFDVRLVDSLAGVPPGEALLVAHPRALAPHDLVALDARARRGAPTVILADALSSWPPPHPLGDPRNPPVTSLLTPLLDHWGLTLALPAPARRGEVAVFVDPGGARLRLHSAGRFTALPGHCRAYGGGLVAQCRLAGAGGAVWLVGDADMLHDGLWRSPFDAAPWLRRSDNIAWLAGRLGGGGDRAAFAPIWIR